MAHLLFGGSLQLALHPCTTPEEEYRNGQGVHRAVSLGVVGGGGFLYD